VSLARRLVSAYLQKLNDPLYDSDKVWLVPMHAKAINTRYSECLLADVADSARGIISRARFEAEWKKIEARIAIGEAQASELSCVRLALLVLKPEQGTRATAAPAPAPTPDQTKKQIAAERRAAALVAQHAEQERLAAAAQSWPPQPPPTPPSGAPPPRGTSGQGAFKGKGSGGTGSPGKGGKGGKGAAPSGHNTEPPPSPAANVPPRAAPGQTSRRYPPPAGGLAKPTPPKGVPPLTTGEWTTDEWRNTLIDFDEMDRIAPFGPGAATRLCHPVDASMTATMLKRPRTADGQGWHINSCAYCAFRPRAPTGLAADHADAWYYGTGDGGHNPYRCDAAKRYIAEGAPEEGLRRHQWADDIRQCLRYQVPRDRSG